MSRKRGLFGLGMRRSRLLFLGEKNSLVNVYQASLGFCLTHLMIFVMFFLIKRPDFCPGFEAGRYFALVKIAQGQPGCSETLLSALKF